MAIGGVAASVPGRRRLIQDVRGDDAEGALELRNPAGSATVEVAARGSGAMARTRAVLDRQRPTVIEPMRRAPSTSTRRARQRNQDARRPDAARGRVRARVRPRDRLTRTRRAVAESGAVIIVEESDTVIATPDDRTIVSASAPATLATAGTRDLLRGIVLGLVAARNEPFLATAAAVRPHDAAANAFGPGLLAADLPDLLPGVLRRPFGVPTCMP